MYEKNRWRTDPQLGPLTACACGAPLVPDYNAQIMVTLTVDLQNLIRPSAGANEYSL